MRLLRVDDVGQEHELLRLVQADQARQHPRAAEVDASVRVGRRSPRTARRRSPPPGRNRARGSAPRRRRHRRPWRSSAAGWRATPCTRRRCDACARVRCPPVRAPPPLRSAPEQNSPPAPVMTTTRSSVGVVVDGAEGLEQLVPHDVVDGVLLLGPVQRDGDDPVGPFDLQSLHEPHDNQADGIQPLPPATPIGRRLRDGRRRVRRGRAAAPVGVPRLERALDHLDGVADDRHDVEADLARPHRRVVEPLGGQHPHLLPLDVVDGLGRRTERVRRSAS